MEVDNTLFMEQFKKISKELNPILLDFVEENNIGDNAILFYFGSVIKETLKEMDDKELKEALIRFIFDE